MTQTILLCLLLVAAAASPVAHAHSVWIEPDNDARLAVRFAEPGQPYESSPGYLDSLSPPRAFVWLTNAPTRVETLKRADRFQPRGASPTNVVCVETAFTVRGGRKPWFYARWQPPRTEPTGPRLTLDLVPTGKPGEVRAYFRGQPLANVKAELHPPRGTPQKLAADAEGYLRFPVEAPGQYLLTLAHHREPLAGFDDGLAYRETSHNCSLSWQEP